MHVWKSFVAIKRKIFSSFQIRKTEISESCWDRMPPPSYCSKVSTRSTDDHEPEIDEFKISKTEISECTETGTEEECSHNNKYDSVNIVKSLLGPSLEDAVLRTLEFGKSLIQRTDENDPKKIQKPSKKDVMGSTQRHSRGSGALGENDSRVANEMKVRSESRTQGKRIVYTAETERDVLLSPKPIKKLSNVSKIRSLDSDLKQVSSSPEKIKRQLEALIQIHKDDPDLLNWNIMSKTPKLPLEMTVMPTICGFKNEADLNCSSSCDVQSQGSRRNNEGDSCASRIKAAAKKRLGAPSKICQAPEFLSNALGPTLDVSIIDNLKMMRDIFKADSPRMEGLTGHIDTPRSMIDTPRSMVDTPLRQEMQEMQLTPRRSQESMTHKIDGLQRRIAELEHKEALLIRQLEEEYRERDMKKKVQDGEKHVNIKSNSDHSSDGSAKVHELEAKYEILQHRIAAEEEKLTRLKEQYERYKRDLCEARSRKEALKRNKSLLDAWDVIASRVCHTRLPSFSKASYLERKTFQPSETSANIHCCLPMPVTPPTVDSPKGGCAGRASRSQCRGSPRNQSSSEFCWSVNACEFNSPSPPRCRKKHEDIPFPLQRDITCGLHQSLKVCACAQDTRVEGVVCSSDDELFKRYAGTHKHCRTGGCCYTSSLDTSAEVLLRKPPCGKSACRSKSDTTLRNKCAKLVKVMWAVTRINIFQDNCRTYEVMDATSTPPSCTPAKTEGIFVVKSSQKKGCQSPQRRKGHANCSGL